ncbi:YihY/virulence factor BrkB family protein [Aquisalimonas sp. 2447]|uniref:YihY/virulence factor BrkB family protein n=1 Tax=Aquisalimonas sp. 2447 TaxID=2740807 RepID=UPI0014326D31|nr:YihY/virulence factor BrkB family protein [Aquisalimonas sp. 2447]QIT56336.1 YihY/virulence factor BrkB family protein [Aquisalimonas sp. 2447]
MPVIAAAKTWFQVFKGAVQLWLDRNAFAYAGALAFYTLFSLAPVMIIAITIIGVVLGPEAAQGQIVDQLEGAIGADAAEAVEGAVAASRLEQAGWLPTVIGVGAILIGATTVFAQMQLSLNAIWGVAARPSRSGLLILLKNRLLSFSVVLVIGFVMLVSMLLTVMLRAVIRFAEEWLPVHASVVGLTELTLSIALITLLFAMVFRILPDVVLSWREVIPGALVTALLFVFGRYLIATYLTMAAPASAYGAAGSLVLLLLWVYYSSLILLFGAAFTKTLLLHRGGRVIPRNMAVRVHNELVDD